MHFTADQQHLSSLPVSLFYPPGTPGQLSNSSFGELSKLNVFVSVLSSNPNAASHPNRTKSKTVPKPKRPWPWAGFPNSDSHLGVFALECSSPVLCRTSCSVTLFKPPFKCPLPFSPSLSHSPSLIPCNFLPSQTCPTSYKIAAAPLSIPFFCFLFFHAPYQYFTHIFIYYRLFSLTALNSLKTRTLSLCKPRLRRVPSMHMYSANIWERQWMKGLWWASISRCWWSPSPQ